MGAWGKGIYDNDDACDFVGEVVDSLDLSRIHAAVNEVLNANQTLEAPLAAQGLVAADVVARLRGQWGERNSYTGVIAQWAERANLTASDELLLKARQVVHRVRTEPSELLELWSDDPDPETWHATLDTLLQRLS
ncbi:MAG TPA: DUF4259 domain-containing protein [Acidobacteriaceae bacterium]|nr:DUF4259 domain-containing protein [Acidobacteriaceae bacterium]